MLSKRGSPQSLRMRFCFMGSVILVVSFLYKSYERIWFLDMQNDSFNVFL